MIIGRYCPDRLYPSMKNFLSDPRKRSISLCTYRFMTSGMAFAGPLAVVCWVA